MQWRNEIEKFTDGFKIAIWHGASREANAKELAKFDVVKRAFTDQTIRRWLLSTIPQVLTTYAVLESSFRKQQSGFTRGGRIVKEKSIVHQIMWHRIIVSVIGY
jgi:DNA repair protein RAD16